MNIDGQVLSIFLWLSFGYKTSLKMKAMYLLQNMPFIFDNFQRWKCKFSCFLTVLNLSYFLFITIFRTCKQNVNVSVLPLEISFSQLLLHSHYNEFLMCLHNSRTSWMLPVLAAATWHEFSHFFWSEESCIWYLLIYSTWLVCCNIVSLDDFYF